MRARKWKIVSANRPKTERVIAADGRNQIWRQFIASDFLGLNLATIIFLRYFVFCLSQGSFTFVPMKFEKKTHDVEENVFSNEIPILLES